MVKIDPLAPGEGALQRYYWYAHSMRVAFNHHHEQGDDRSTAWMYASLWFSLLYVVVEGWRELGLTDPDVDRLLTNVDSVNRIRLFRNGTFHFQSTYWDSRHQALIDDPETALWVAHLTNAFRDYFARRAIETNHPAISGIAPG